MMNLTSEQEHKVRCLVGYERYLRQQPHESNTIELPFSCHHCNEPRFDLEMIDGDGKPICTRCFERIVRILEG
jgi:formylmethanofuran dehydrogenase subunit E